jgi:tripeptidyl-peptidase-1
MRTFVFALLLVVAAVFAADPRVPSGWVKIGRPAADEKIQLIIAVRQQNTDKLNSIFHQVSDPEHPNYGKHLTIDEITSIVAPADETREAVLSWLKLHGVTPYFENRNKDFFFVKAHYSVVEKMLDVEFNTYHHAQRNYTVTRTTQEYNIPVFVQNHIDFIVGQNGFPTLHSIRRNNAQSAAQVTVTPSVLRQRYNVSAVGRNSKNKQAVAEFQEQYLSPSDLSSFCRQYVPQNPSCTVAKVVGSNDNSDPGVEAMLDIEYIMGVAPNVPTWFYSTPSLDFFSDLTSWIVQILDDSDAPWVHSVSYGDQAEGPAGSYKDRLNTEFQKAGARGISIIFASGDSGTGCSACYYFEPSFPATSPYVTSVGATRFLGDQIGPEAAVSQFHSGGGFSWFFDMPGWQKTVVEAYLSGETDLPSSHYYNPKGRGTPDVAALGIGFSVLVDGSVESVGGTSASAPTFSAIVTLLNEVRLSNNKPTLGFLNPWLYQTSAANPSAFWDVTVGNNQDGCCGYTGFNCRQGWDPVTGLGTPNYAELVKHL